MPGAESRILCTMPEGTYRRMFTPELEAELEALGRVVHCRNADELTEHAYTELWRKADAAVTGWGTRHATPAMLEAAQDLRIICHTAGTVRGVPRQALERGVVVTSARSAIARTVAEFCLMHAILLLRRMPAYIDRDPARRAALGDAARPASRTLWEKTVGLVGYGHVAREFRALLAPFDCRILVHDPYLSPEAAADARVSPVALDELMARADVVSLHLPDIPETRNLIGRAQLRALRDGAILINSARGRVVDTDALTDELRTGRLLAAIDVTHPEPLPEDHPLRRLPNVIWTPHVAGPTDDDLPHLTRTALADLRRFLSGEEPLHAVSLAAYDLMSF